MRLVFVPVYPPSRAKRGPGRRAAKAIEQIDGKRLEYWESVDNTPYRPAIDQFMTPEQAEAPFDE